MKAHSGRLSDLLPGAIRHVPSLPLLKNVDFERSSFHVAMDDGVKLAVDICLPKDRTPGAKLPTLYSATRYWRASADAPLPDSKKKWIARGYAVVSADMRGTGASFGQWYIPYSPREVRDIGLLANWIAHQDWSNGKVVMTGTSYTATTTLVGPAYGTPAIRAVAPKFSDFDMYADWMFPGGVPAEALLVKWGDIMHRRDHLNEYAGTSGVRPVDGPEGKKLLAAAVEDHKRHMVDFGQCAYLAIYKDQPLPEFGNAQLDECCTYRHQDAIMHTRVPIFGWGSWRDSGGARGLLNRFMTWTNPQLTVIGPWTHGARENVDVFLPSGPPEPPMDEQDDLIFAFLNHYVASEDPRPIVDRTILYFTMGQDRWKKTDTWPVPGTRSARYYLAEGNTLTPGKPRAGGRDSYNVDFEASTGPANRWAQSMGPIIDYGDRAEADKRLLVYTGAPLSTDLVITGQPLVTIHLISTHEDGNIFTYLEDVAPNGRVTYLTEGELRVLHRRLSTGQAPYKTVYPFRSYSRGDGAPLVVGEIATLIFEMQATSVLVRANHRLRVSIGGADEGTFLRLPREGDVTLHILRGGDYASFVELPIEPPGL